MSKRTGLILAILLAIAVVAALVYVLTHTNPAASQLKELDANLQKWQSQGITRYEMKVHIGCFCPFADRMPLTVEVVDGKPVSVVDSQGQNVPADDPMRSFGNESLLTIEGLFDYTREAIQTADQTKVSYDPDLGYPVSLSIDRIRQAADDELGVQISDLHTLP